MSLEVSKCNFPDCERMPKILVQFLWMEIKNNVWCVNEDKTSFQPWIPYCETHKPITDIRVKPII